MPWLPMTLRNARVLVRADDGGAPLVQSGKVEIRYKPADGRAYHASVGNLQAIRGAELLPDDHCAPAEAAPKGGATKKAAARKDAAKAKHASAEVPDNAVVVYADGACSGNPGPAGLGVVVLDPARDRRELSEYLGVGTNNVAELTAILRAAELLAGRDEPVHIYTDSKYAIGVLTQGWKAKKNPELIASVKAALAKLPDVSIHYVPGHAGVALNERADELARAAVLSRANSGWAVSRSLPSAR